MQSDQPKIIAGMYKILSEIGSGGAGIVYIGEHIRLNKKIVLKADKRNVFTSSDTLRREVEALKNLNHSYIPQVYDFIIEDDIAYTVMDFIEGESLDKILKSGMVFEQASVVKIAIQLLQALEYLHTRPPYGILHSDIKPANIMIRSDGDICLIDYNIALTLGIDGAIAVGRSFGYASPEHYILSGSEDEKTKAWFALTSSLSQTTLALTARTETLQEQQTHTQMNQDTQTLSDSTLLEEKEEVSSNQTSKKTREDMDYITQKIFLDVRSDIYGVGAVLYHLVMGSRPEKFAQDIIPLKSSDFSKAFLKIINKAISPKPDDRYQSAKEMLDAIYRLKRDDDRSVKYRIRVRISSIFLTLLLLCGIGLMFIGIKQDEALKNSYLLAQRSKTALEQADVDSAIRFALASLPQESLFAPPKIAQSELALSNALGVYNLGDTFKPYGNYELSSQLIHLELSDDGKYALAFYMGYLDIIDIATLKKINTLETLKTAMVDAVFVSDDQFLFTGVDGLCLYDIGTNKKEWIADKSTRIRLSEDGNYCASIYKNQDYAHIYEVKTGQFIKRINFSGKIQRVPENDVFSRIGGNAFSISSDAKHLVISFEDGSLVLFDIESGEEMELISSDMNFLEFEAGFYNEYLAFCASSDDRSVFVIFDTQSKEQTGGFDSKNKFSTYTDRSGIYVQTENILVKIDPITGEQTALADMAEMISDYKISDEHVMVASGKKISIYDKSTNLIKNIPNTFGKPIMDISGSNLSIGSLDSNNVIFMSYDKSEEANLFHYDPRYIHDEARIISEDQGFVLFSYDVMMIFDIDGKLKKQIDIPNADSLYDQQFRRLNDEVYLENIYNDGKIIAYNAFDGEILFEKQGEIPDKSLDEIFYTSKYKIEAPLHGNVIVYDKKTGEAIREFREDAYLTYITELGDNFVAQFMTADGYYYGLLFDSEWEILADFPYLCDVYADQPVFDYHTENLRKSKIYDLSELLEMVQKR